MEILKKLWTGEYSLVKTYWLFYVLIWNLTLLPLVLWRETSQSTQDSYILLGLLFSVIFISYGCVVLVGLWRSASKYAGWWLWASLVKVIVLMGFILVAVSIFGALQTNLMVGSALLISAFIALVVAKFYGTDGYTRNVKIFLIACLALLALIVVSLVFNLNSMAISKKSKWTPIINSIVMNYAKDRLDTQITYLDFSSITQINGKIFANVANEYMSDGQFEKSTKQYVEFVCSQPAKLRVLGVISYKDRVSDGFGMEVGRNDDVQSTQAKSAVANGMTYTGGWDEYDSLQKNILNYCVNQPISSDVKEKFNLTMCSYAKRDLTILKAVCENK